MTRAQKMQKQIEKILKLRDQGKQKYAQADAVLDELTHDMQPGDSVEIKGGKRAELVDNFDGKNKVFKPCGICRYDLKVSAA